MSGFRTAAVGSLKTTSRPMRYRSSSSALAATALKSYTPLMAPTSSAVGSALLYQTSPALILEVEHEGIELGAARHLEEVIDVLSGGLSGDVDGPSNEWRQLDHRLAGSAIPFE